MTFKVSSKEMQIIILPLYAYLEGNQNLQINKFVSIHEGQIIIYKLLTLLLPQSSIHEEATTLPFIVSFNNLLYECYTYVISSFREILMRFL